MNAMSNARGIARGMIPRRVPDLLAERCDPRVAGKREEQECRRLQHPVQTVREPRIEMGGVAFAAEQARHDDDGEHREQRRHEHAVQRRGLRRSPGS